MERAKSSTKLKNKKAPLDAAAILEAVPCGIIAADSGGRIAGFNREASRLLRQDPEAMLGKKIDALAPIFRDTLEWILRTGEEICDKDVQTGEGDEMLQLRLRGGKTPDGGVVIILQDVSEIKKLESQIQQTDRLVSVGKLSAGMAHEIKNPLVTIKTFTQLLPERFDDKDFRENFCQLMAHEVKRIDSIVSQMLNFARPAEPKIEKLRLHDILSGSLSLIMPRSDQKGVTITRKFDASKDAILGDSNQLEQALINFYINSIDAMEQGGELTVATQIVEGKKQAPPRQGARANEWVQISIKDTGIGIKNEDISRVFEPFFTSKSHGTGLGLSIAQAIISEHQGTIKLESVLNAGTTFHIVLPLLTE